MAGAGQTSSKRDARLPVYLNNQQGRSLDEEAWLLRLEKLHAACGLGAHAEWGLTWVDAAGIHALNLQYRGVDAPTDVLAFALEEGGDPLPGPEGRLLGDVIVAVDVADSQAAARGHDLQAELALLAVHGLLHLMGEDHDTPERKARMWERQAALLRELGFDSPTLLSPELLEMPVKATDAPKRRRGGR